MKNIVGSPVEDGDFFGREAEVAGFVDLLLQGNDILLLGPRRIGKTSVGRAVMRTLTSRDWQVIELNVATCLDETGFVRKLGQAIREHTQSDAGKLVESVREGVSGWLHRIEGIEASIPGIAKGGLKLRPAEVLDWTEPATGLLQLLAGQQRRWLIYIDELPIFLHTLIRSDATNGVARVRRFLDWFRNDVRALPGGQELRWFVTGSVGLDTLVQRHGMADTINSLKHEYLPPFDRLRAQAMLRALAGTHDLPWDEQAAERMIEAVHWLQPYYLQLLFSGMRQLGMHSPPADATALLPLIEQAAARLTSPEVDNDFQHWEQRLTLQLDEPDAGHARALLTLAAQSRDGARAQSLLVEIQGRLPNLDTDRQRQKFYELRDILLRDGYWQANGEGAARRYRFNLEPLRRWWARRQAL